MLRGATARIGLFLLACGAMPLLVWAAGNTKPGMVVTRDNPPRAFVGEVDNSDPAHVQIDTAAGRLSIDRRNVMEVKFFNSPTEEFNSRLAVLDPKDVEGHVDLASFAAQHEMYPQARQLLVSALAVAPGNRKATDLLQDVDARIKAAAQAQTKPADQTNAQSGPMRAQRTLTPEEINAIRQLEWSGPEKEPNIRVQLTPDLRKRAIDAGVLNQGALDSMTTAQIGWEIVRKSEAAPDLSKDVKLLNDPGAFSCSPIRRWPMQPWIRIS
jgi:hypothetical protein